MYNINKVINNYMIVNMDETALFLNMSPKKTINEKGDNTIMIKTLGQEKQRISILLSVSAEGDKLAALVVFKGKPNGKICKNLNNNLYVKQKYLFVRCNTNGWCTKSIMNDYNNDIWEPYINKHKFDMGRALLIFDNAPMHTGKDIENIFINKNKRLVYIPKGLTSILQPLDIAINNLFKKGIQEKYTQYITENNNCSKIERNIFLNWIYEVWYSSKYITKQVIINTFKATGISLDINGSENGLIKSYEWAKEHMNNCFTEKEIEKNVEFNLEDRK